MIQTCTKQLFMASLAGLILWSTGCGSSRESYDATIRYVVNPSHELPAGLNTVAVLDSDAEFSSAEDEDRARKWATIAADMMERMVRDAADNYGSNLAVSKRRDTTRVLAEQDMKAAGLVDAGTAARTAKLLDVQALITSKLNVRVEVKKSKKTTFDLAHLAGGRGFGSGSIRSREADQIARNITVQCKFSMLDAATGEALFEYAPKPFRKMDSKKPSPIFGRSAGEADLDPVDMYIGELVEKGVRDFVGMFIPCEVEQTYELESSRHEESSRGVRLLRADDFEGAMAAFRLAMAEDPDDHATMFCMGVTSEMTDNWDQALGFYRKAAAMSHVDDDELAMYLDAKNRLLEHKNRIRKSGS
ncbi:MAG: hypothetical protein V3T70_04865 [Phycisphaerae bacterium]